MSALRSTVGAIRLSIVGAVFFLLSCAPDPSDEADVTITLGEPEDIEITVELEDEALLALIEKNPVIAADYFALTPESEVLARRVPGEEVEPFSIGRHSGTYRVETLSVTAREDLLNLIVLNAVDERRLLVAANGYGAERTYLVEGALKAEGDYNETTKTLLDDEILRIAAYVSTSQKFYVLNPYDPSESDGNPSSCGGKCLPCPGGVKNCYAGDNSFVVELRANGKRHCSAAAVSKKVFITAGHCLINGEKKRFAENDLTIKVKSKLYAVAGFDIHDGYGWFDDSGIVHDRDRRFDVAVVTISEKSIARPIALFPPSNFEGLRPGPVPVTIAGFGVTNAPIKNYEGPLFGKQYIPIDGIDLQGTQNYSFQWLHNLLKNRDASGNCKSDSGGPIVKEAPPFSNDPVQLMGVISGLKGRYDRSGTDPEVAQSCYKTKGGVAVNLLAANVRPGFCDMLSAQKVLCPL